MSKIKRQGDATEDYKITSDWLSDFAKGISKNAGEIDYLKEYLDKQRKNKKFNTIEEKLNDIKARIGFNLIQKLSSEMDPLDKTAAKISTASKIDEEKELVMKIINFARSVVEKEPHLSSIEVMNKLRQVDSYQEFLNKRIDYKKMIAQIEKFITMYDKDVKEEGEEVYHQQADTKQDTAQISEVWNHAQPSKV